MGRVTLICVLEPVWHCYYLIVQLLICPLGKWSRFDIKLIVVALTLSLIVSMCCSGLDTLELALIVYFTLECILNIIKIAPPLLALVMKIVLNLPLNSSGDMLCLAAEYLWFAIHPSSFVFLSSMIPCWNRAWLKLEILMSWCKFTVKFESEFWWKKAFHSNFLMNSSVPYLRSSRSSFRVGTNSKPFGKER